MKKFLFALAIFSFVSGCAHRAVFLNQNMPASYGVFLLTYRLDRCPKNLEFDLPRTGHGEAPVGTKIRTEAGYYAGPYCHGFKKYLFIEEHSGITNRQINPVYARFERITDERAGSGGHSSTCQLRVGLPTERLCTNQRLEECGTFLVASEYARKFAGLLLEGAGVRIVEPVLELLGYSSRDAFADACMARVDQKLKATSSKIFHQSGQAN